MNDIDIIKLINAKIFHDLGNKITILSLLDNLNDKQSNAIQELVFHFTFLRQIFVEFDTQNDLSSCYKALSKYFNNKKITLKDFSHYTQHQLSQDQHQLLINIVISLATSISHSGNIDVNFTSDGFEVKASPAGSINNSTEQILTDKKQKMNTKNIQNYFTLLLANNIGAKIKYSHYNNSTIAAKVIYGNM
ncbi:MAG: hypothetical protein HRK26_01305 [Rickettsiaceae bacterium H1]|nr:hypothetical protein [Rickettsiaceae bacterium H1]